MTITNVAAQYAANRLRNANFLVKVRLSGSTYRARWGKGRDAVTATCTSGEDQAAIAVAKKYLEREGAFGMGRALVARSYKSPDYLPGLRLRSEYGVSWWEVRLSREDGGVL